MSDKGPNSSFLSALFHYGPVPAGTIFFSALFVWKGASGDLSLSNRHLLLGGFLYCFGVMWYHLGQILAWHDDDEGRRPWTVSKPDLGACLFFLLLSFLWGYVFLSGHLPF